MKCYYCGSILSKVIDKREVKTTAEIRRRRECLKCHKRYTTYERTSGGELTIIKRDGRKEVFDREKLRGGIAKALEKRPGLARLQEITDRIENKLKLKSSQQIPSKIIGKLVLYELKKIDPVAYLRFVSVYRHFEEPGDFTKELQAFN